MPTPLALTPLNRREALQRAVQAAGLLASLGCWLGNAWSAYPARAFEAKGVEAALKAMGGALPVESRDVTLMGPDVAENGAQVALTVSTTLAQVKRVLVLVDKNPAALVAAFDVTPEIEANFQLRTKMQESSAVHAVAMLADGRVLFARKDIQVVMGGCAN